MSFRQNLLAVRQEHLVANPTGMKLDLQRPQAIFMV